MSSFKINSVGLDEITLELNTYGKNESTCILKHNLLDENLNYMMCVDYLKVPLNKVGMFHSVGGTLFRILRRNVGTNIGTEDLSLLAGVSSEYTLDEQFHDVSLFVKSLKSFVEGFNVTQTRHGNLNEDGLYAQYGGDINILDDDGDIPFGTELGVLNSLPNRTDDTEPTIQEAGHYNFLNFNLTGDYRLEIVGSSDFWNNFYIDFTRRGAELLGFSNSVVRTEHGNILGLTIDGEGLASNNILSGLDILIPGGHSREVNVISECSLLQSAEQRYKLTVETHLPIQSNLQIINEKEQLDRSICEVHFDNTSEIQMVFDSDGNYSSTAIENKLYFGDYPLVKKSDVNKKYTKLLTSFEQRFMRFHLYVWYRYYDSAKDVWNLVKKLVEIPTNRSWVMLLRFISEV